MCVTRKSPPLEGIDGRPQAEGMWVMRKASPLAFRATEREAAGRDGVCDEKTPLYSHFERQRELVAGSHTQKCERRFE